MLKLEKVTKLEEYIFIENIYNNNLEYLVPNKSASILKEIRAKEIKEDYDQNRNKKLYVVYKDEEMLGFLSWQKDYKFLKSGKKDTVFLFFGFDDKYLGMSLVKTTFSMFENLLNEISFKYIEVSVFDFDKRGQKFYDKMGFVKLSELENCTYYDGKWHSEYRYLKELKKERF